MSVMASSCRSEPTERIDRCAPVRNLTPRPADALIRIVSVMHNGAMTIDPAAGRRETLTLPAQDARFVDRLMDPKSLERWALHQLAGKVGDSKAAILRAAFHVGVDRIAELALDEGYRQLAEATTEAEIAEDRAITASRRRRAAARGDE